MKPSQNEAQQVIQAYRILVSWRGGIGVQKKRAPLDSLPDTILGQRGVLDPAVDDKNPT